MNGRFHPEFVMDRMSFRSCTTALQTPLHPSNVLLTKFLDVCVVVYLDDTMIYSDNPDGQLRHVREVLRHLRVNHLYAETKECAFSVDTTVFLGSVFGPDSLQMNASKVQVIRDWSTP